MNGWPDKVETSVEVYKKYDLELAVEEGCIMWGHRIIIPYALRKRVLQDLHSAHLGIVKMKMIARSHMWWPKLDCDIEALAKSCKLCVEHASNPPKAELHRWPWPEEPNQRLHVDFTGPIDGYMYIVIIDSFSKWIDIKEMHDCKAEATIDVLRDYFSVWGITKTIVSDNGPTLRQISLDSF
ncbi:hypothetical protein X777_04041 [Ooceraea biroi]|uniref:RNA-directed DNA polymerase n=1 Tax=Ooceraea biroi TaxID=2015173 RepID=A0A026WJ63_OOCBI|nr:hypothetical protein X777_04041 [Ooceraea biroi]